MNYLMYAQDEATPGDSVSEITNSIQPMYDKISAFVVEQGPGYLFKFIAALLIFVIGRWIAKILVHVTRNVMKRAKLDATLMQFLDNILYMGLLAMVVLAALDQLGVNTTSFTAVLATAGLAVGLALKDSLANFASGVMLILFKPFRVGDFIEAGGTSGVVEEIHIFHTKMRTGDNKGITIPNGNITSDVITNYSAKPTRRIDLVVGCGYDDNLRDVKQYLEELVTADGRVLLDPEPVVAVSELGDSCVNFVVRPWVKSADYWDVRWELTERIKTGFDERGFSIPYPQQDLHLHKVE